MWFAIGLVALILVGSFIYLVRTRSMKEALTAVATLAAGIGIAFWGYIQNFLGG